MRFSKVFSAFLEEALFTREILAIGVTQLYKANYSTKGMYYQTFICLSTGIERMTKLCILLDYYIDNYGKLPSENYIRTYGHKISDLFEACQKIAERQEIKFRFSYEIEEQIHKAIVEVLSDFAKTSGRYSNVNILVGNEKNSDDCIEKWFSMIDLPIYEKHITEKRKRSIELRAHVIGSFLNECSSTFFIGEDNVEMTDAIEASRRTGIWEAVAPYRQLYMLRIIRYLTELIMGLEYKARKYGLGEIPSFGEIFGLFYNGDSYFRGRKTWDKL